MNPYDNKTMEERAAMALKSAETRRRNKAAKEAERQASLDLRDTLKCEIASLQASLSQMVAFHETSLQAAMMTGKFLLSHDAIVAGSQPYGDSPGIYFLVRQGEVVYVGQSINVHARVWQHKQARKDFDAFTYVKCERDSLDALESLYIHTLRPRLNGDMCTGEKLAPLSLASLLPQLRASAVTDSPQ